MPAAGDEPPLASNVHAEHVPRVPLEPRAQRPVVRAEHVDALVEPAAGEERAGFLRREDLARLGVGLRERDGGVVAGRFEPAQVRDDALVGADAADAADHAHIPAFSPAVAGAGEDAVTVRGPVEGVELADVAVEDHDGTAGAQVPDAADAVEAAGREQGAVGVEGEGVDFARVAFLK